MSVPMTLADLISDLLAEAPLTGFEITRALAERHGIPILGREGEVYVALVQLERLGWIESEWTPGPAGDRRRRYRLPVLGAVGGQA
jgi:DNA-binding PadR family transcriptional regulator